MRNARPVIWTYNLDNGRPDALVNREIAHILDTRPLVLIGVEATGLKAMRHPDYRLIRDRSTKSRDNILAYVHRGHRYQPGGWLDLHGTWPRTEGPGIHEARSFPWFWVEGLKVAGVHLPPNNAQGRDQLQTECIDALIDLDPDIASGDFNGRKGDPGSGKPDALAHELGARVVGERIDCAVVRRGIRVSRVRYPERAGRLFGRVQLQSDHQHAFRFTIDIPKESR